MFTQQEKELLRSLACKVREYADTKQNAERKKEWYRHNALQKGKPMVLCFPEGAWLEIFPENSLSCTHPLAQVWELALRKKIYTYENIDDDFALEPYMDIDYVLSYGSLGLESARHHGENRGSFTWTPAISDLHRDVEKLTLRTLTVDREKTAMHFDIAKEIFSEFLPPRMRTRTGTGGGVSGTAINLLGMENFLMAMYDCPDGLHKLMKHLSEDRKNMCLEFERQGLYTLNNENDYTGSGGVAYTNELPAKDYKQGSLVRNIDIWGFTESQETLGISPDMYGEFIFPYLLPLNEMFGLNCYGCCEPVENIWEYIRKIPRLRRVSISPWCNQEKMAENMSGGYIFSRKPNPTMVCAGFDETEIRTDIRNTLALTKNCITEIILKDTHTIQNHPERFGQFVRIVREEIEKI